ncbi:MAG: sugar phosphate isomerase/epimerase [Clostridia bacterium]|nr:sugar phosphate isomerase/epimerase [Clostridia bacterium]
MREVAVVVRNDNIGVNAIETIDAIKKAGFRNVFIQWYNESWIPTQEEQLKYIKSQNLNVIFAHLGYRKVNNIWVEGNEGEKVVEEYKNDIKMCKKNNIPMVVMHLTLGLNPPELNYLGIKRLQEIADYAKELDIKIAFENVEVKGSLEYVLENIKNENVGICFDVGHNHVFFDDQLDLTKFKDKIFAVHFHDNDKTADLHLLPFDGTLNWENVIKNVKVNNYNGPVTLEPCYNYDYLNNSVEQFYDKAFDIGKRLSLMFE